jgi:hypothetical protein
MADVSGILGALSSGLGAASRLPGYWGIAAGLGSALLGVGSTLAKDDPRSHVTRLNDATPKIAAAMARADALKARLRAGGAA